jgi:hypothetical protein
VLLRLEAAATMFGTQRASVLAFSILVLHVDSELLSVWSKDTGWVSALKPTLDSYDIHLTHLIGHYLWFRTNPQGANRHVHRPKSNDLSDGDGV